MQNKPWKEAGKEVLRLVVFSIPAAAILFFSENPALAGAYGVPILYVLRALDKAIHEDTSNGSKGLVPF